MNNHKGPWTLHEGMTHMSVRNSETDTIFCDLKNVPGVREDARLISAAPKMYSLLAIMAKQGNLEAQTLIQEIENE